MVASQGGRRKASAAYEDRDPDVLVVGGGQAGLAIAARLKQLKIDALIRKLDVPIPGEGAIHIHHLENADAEDAVPQNDAEEVRVAVPHNPAAHPMAENSRQSRSVKVSTFTIPRATPTTTSWCPSGS